jgi:hypothetical protein
LEVLGHRGVTTKGEAIDFLTQLVTENRKTLDEVLVLVQNAKPYVPLPEVQPDPRLDEALVNIQDRLHDLGKAVELKAQAAVEKAERDVQSKLAGVKSADSSLISETIRAEVAKVFAPFKQDASPEVLAEIAGRIGQFRTERAGDIFPVTAYGNVDFGDLQVGIWSDPEAPALVDDYVFNPPIFIRLLSPWTISCPTMSGLPGSVARARPSSSPSWRLDFSASWCGLTLTRPWRGPTSLGPIRFQAVT